MRSTSGTEHYKLDLTKRKKLMRHYKVCFSKTFLTMLWIFYMSLMGCTTDIDAIHDQGLLLVLRFTLHSSFYARLIPKGLILMRI